MEILYILIPIAFVLVGLAVKLLFWAVKSGQYDDLDTEGKRILFDEPISKAQSSPSDSKSDADAITPNRSQAEP